MLYFEDVGSRVERAQVQVLVQLLTLASPYGCFICKMGKEASPPRAGEY